MGTTPSVVELVVVVRKACEALGCLAAKVPQGRIYLTGISLDLNADLGRAGRKPRKSEAYLAVAVAIEKARVALDRCNDAEGVGRGFWEGAGEDAEDQYREIRDRLASLQASAQISCLSAETAAADELVQVHIGAPGMRLLEFAQVVEAWVQGRIVIPAGGPPEPLRSALSVFALALRNAAMRNKAVEAASGGPPVL